MRSAALVLLLASAVPPAAIAQTPAPAPTESAQSLYDFMLARYLENEGDEEGALQALKRAESADPKSAEIKSEIAALFARQNRGPEAVEAAERALALDPDSAEAHRILGLVFAAWADAGLKPPEGRTAPQLRQQAIDHLTKIFDTPAVATDLNLQVTLGRLHLRSGQAEKAIPVLETRRVAAPERRPSPTRCSPKRAWRSDVSNRRPRRSRWRRRSIPAITPRLASSTKSMGNWEGAAEAYSNAVQSARNPPRDLRLRMIGALLNVGNPAAAQMARDQLKDLVAGAPQDTRLLYLLASANRQIGEYAAAEDAARKILSIDPTSVTALYALSQVFFAQQEPKKVVDLLTPFAKDAASRGKGNETDAALVMAQLGFAHLQLGDPNAAIAAFTTAKGFAPKNPAYDAYLDTGPSQRQAARARGRDRGRRAGPPSGRQPVDHSPRRRALRWWTPRRSRQDPAGCARRHPR